MTMTFQIKPLSNIPSDNHLFNNHLPNNLLLNRLLLNRLLFNNLCPHTMKTNNKLITLNRKLTKMMKLATFGLLPSRVMNFTLSNLISLFKSWLAWPKLSC